MEVDKILQERPNGQMKLVSIGHSKNGKIKSNNHDNLIRAFHFVPNNI